MYKACIYQVSCGVDPQGDSYITERCSEFIDDVVYLNVSACGSRVDVVFGIPDSNALGQEFKDIKDFFSKLSTLFQLNAKTTHIGVIRYSDDADMVIKLNEKYDPDGITASIEKLKQRGTGFNVKRALQVAADNAFTIFGGVRQTAPKTYVLFVPGDVQKVLFSQMCFLI
jgi:hypothetical protein